MTDADPRGALRSGEPATGTTASARYELRVGGHLDESWSSWFGDLAVCRNPDGTTTLRGTVTDQAALHGLLARVRDLGLTLVSLSPLPAEATTRTTMLPR